MNKRLSAEEALSHEWFKYIFSQNSFDLIEKQRNSYKVTHLNEIVQSIKNFRAEKKLQQASLSYIVHNLTSSEDCKELRNIFIAFDLNGDGRLTKDELIQGMCQVMTKGEAEYLVENLMSMIDIDKSGYIEYEEFLRAAIKKEKILSKDNIRHAFNMFDKDKSGYISKSELKEILGSGKNCNMKDDVWISIVNEIDDNSDGMISYEEFCEMMNKLIV
jgi:calcium-dependent protein kinase